MTKSDDLLFRSNSDNLKKIEAIVNASEEILSYGLPLTLELLTRDDMSKVWLEFEKAKLSEKAVITFLSDISYAEFHKNNSVTGANLFKRISDFNDIERASKKLSRALTKNTYLFENTNVSKLYQASFISIDKTYTEIMLGSEESSNEMLLRHVNFIQDWASENSYRLRTFQLNINKFEGKISTKNAARNHYISHLYNAVVKLYGHSPRKIVSIIKTILAIAFKLKTTESLDDSIRKRLAALNKLNRTVNTKEKAKIKAKS